MSNEQPEGVEVPFDYEAEKEKISARYAERTAKLDELIKRVVGVSEKEVEEFKGLVRSARRLMEAKRDHPKSDYAKDDLFEDQWDAMVLSERLTDKRQEIEKEEREASSALEARRLNIESRKLPEALKELDEI